VTRGCADELPRATSGAAAPAMIANAMLRLRGPHLGQRRERCGGVLRPRTETKAQKVAELPDSEWGEDPQVVRFPEKQRELEVAGGRYVLLVFDDANARLEGAKVP